MDAADLEWLQSEPGRAAAAEAAVLLASTTELAALRRLGRRYNSVEARAAVALAVGRRSAAPKFEDAAALFCDREAAEQASSELVARHIAARFERVGSVADLGCGMGGDALAIARHAPILAVDRDPARLAMLRANAGVRGLDGRIEAVAADLDGWQPPDAIEALWADPARRDSSGRRLTPDAWSPSLARVLDLAAGRRGAGVKLAPGIDLDLLPPDAEVEFISLDRQVKAAVLWLGALRRTPRTATVLDPTCIIEGTPDSGVTPLGDPAAYLYDPDPVVGRAGLIDVLAVRLRAWKLDDRIAYLTSDEARDTPFARRLAVHEWHPFSVARLRSRLRALQFGRVEVARRGSPVDTNALERDLNRGLPRESTRVATVILTRLRGVHVALICERDRGVTGP